MNKLRQSRSLHLPSLASLAPWAPFAGLLTLTLATGGCAGILGLEDREVGSDDGGGTSTGSMSSSGSTGSGSGASSSSHGSSSGSGVGADDAGRGDLDAEERDSSKGTGGDDATTDSPVTVIDASSSCPSSGICYLATGLTAPWLIVADSANVYWTELGSTGSTADGAVKACAVTGCAQPLVYASGLVGPRGIAIDADHIYWDTQSADTSVATGGVFSCPLTGCSGAPQQLAVGTTPYGLAVDATYVYWVDENDLSVHRVAKNGTGTDHFLVAANDSNNPMSDMGQVALDSSYLYVNDQIGGGLYRVPVAGGAEPTVVYNSEYAFDWPVTVDATYLYYGESNVNNVGHILRINKTSPFSHTAIATGLVNPYGVAIDGQTSPLVYWADNGTGSTNGTVGRVSSAGTGQTNLTTALADPSGIAVNATYAFWSDLGGNDGTEYIAGGGFIARIAK
jgi:hypothetical protein